MIFFPVEKITPKPTATPKKNGPEKSRLEIILS
jgi:hypothetical protein